MTKRWVAIARETTVFESENARKNGKHAVSYINKDINDRNGLKLASLKYRVKYVEEMITNEKLKQ